MEYRKICNVCGHIWCYTDEDLKVNENNKNSAKLYGLAGAMMLLGGSTFINGQVAGIESNQVKAKVVDYDKCPSCGSKDISNFDGGINSVSPNSQNVVSRGPQNISLENIDSILKRATFFLEDKEWGNAEAYFNSILDVDAENATAYLGLACARNRKQSIDDFNADEFYDLIEKDSNYAKFIRFSDANIQSEIIVTRAEDFIKKAKSMADYHRIISLLKRVEGYKNSNDLIETCNKEIERIEEGIETERQEKITKKIDEGTEDSLHKALSELQNGKDFDGAKELRDIAEKKLHERETVAKSERKIAIIIISVVLVILLGIILFFTTIRPKMRYNKAISYFDSENYSAAELIFEELGNYKDSKVLYKKSVLFQLNPGDEFDFGSEKWFVINKNVKYHTIFAIATESVKHMSFYEDKYLISSNWADSQIREWLNDEFYEDTFDDLEKSMINTTTCKNNSCEDTEDRVFLLSLGEFDMFKGINSSVFENLNYGDGYWTRTTDEQQNNTKIYCIYGFGSMSVVGTYGDEAVIPAIYINCAR